MGGESARARARSESPPPSHSRCAHALARARVADGRERRASRAATRRARVGRGAICNREDGVCSRRTNATRNGGQRG